MKLNTFIFNKTYQDYRWYKFVWVWGLEAGDFVSGRNRKKIQQITNGCLGRLRC